MSLFFYGVFWQNKSNVTQFFHMWESLMSACDQIHISAGLGYCCKMDVTVLTLQISLQTHSSSDSNWTSWIKLNCLPSYTAPCMFSLLLTPLRYQLHQVISQCCTGCGQKSTWCWFQYKEACKSLNQVKTAFDWSCNMTVDALRMWFHSDGLFCPQILFSHGKVHKS